MVLPNDWCLMTTKAVKTSFSISPVTFDDLCFVSERLGVSRSALVSQLLGAPLADMRTLLANVPAAPTAADIVRFRGESMRIVEERVSSLDSLLKDSGHD